MASLEVVGRQERIDELLLPYRKMSMSVKMARWDLERVARPVAPLMVDTRNDARRDN